MKSITKITLASLAFILLLSGCASSSMQSTTFIPNPKILKESPLNEGTLYFIEKDVDFNKYNVKVQAIEIIEDNKEEPVNKKLANEIASYFTEKLSNDFNNVPMNNSKDNQDVALYVSLTAIDVSYNDLKFYQYLPYGLAFTALKRGSGFEGKKVRVALSLKIVDKKTSKILAIVVDKKVGEEVKNKEVLSLNDVKPLLDAWSKRFSTRLTELKSGKYKQIMK